MRSPAVLQNVFFAKRPWPSGNQPRFLLTSWFIDLKMLNHEARTAGPPMTLGNMRELRFVI